MLQVNFRGSAGFGKRFLNLGNREWGRRMQDDLSDAVAWAVREGIAEPKKVAIAGHGYGGYAALMGLVSSPDTYRCGASGFGPLDLAAFVRAEAPAQDDSEPEGRRIAQAVRRPDLQEGPPFNRPPQETAGVR